jgi:hypothetical protein
MVIPQSPLVLLLIFAGLPHAFSDERLKSVYIGGSKEAGSLPRAQAAKESPVPPPMYLPPFDDEASQGLGACGDSNSSEVGNYVQSRFRIGDFSDILGLYSGVCPNNYTDRAICYPRADMSATELSDFLQRLFNKRCKLPDAMKDPQHSNYAYLYTINKLLAARNMPYSEYTQLYISSAFSCEVAVQLSIWCTETATTPVTLFVANHLSLALCPSVSSPLKNIMHILEGHNLVAEARVLFREVMDLFSYAWIACGCRAVYVYVCVVPELQYNKFITLTRLSR